MPQWRGFRAVIFSGGSNDDNPLGWPSEAKVMMLHFNELLLDHAANARCWEAIQRSGIELEYILEQTSTSTITNARNTINLLLDRMELPLPAPSTTSGIDLGVGHGRLLAGSAGVTRAQVLVPPPPLNGLQPLTFTYRGLQRILVVTSQYHHYRSKLIFDKLTDSMKEMNARQLDHPAYYAYLQQPDLMFEMASLDSQEASQYIRQFDFFRELAAIVLYKYMGWI